jgi:hypothetical protein
MNYPCTAKEAVARGQAALRMGGEYGLGTGNYHPGPYAAPMTNGDVPWTGTPPASDCAGFAICYAWKIVRHRPGFNHGSWATVSDDVNVNSAIEDGDHARELFTTLGPPWRAQSASQPIALPRPGDLLCYPTFRCQGLTFIGHVALVESVPDDWKAGDRWSRLTVLQCHGPNGFKPGVVRTDGAIWDHHDAIWPLPQHRTVVVRPHERA